MPLKTLQARINVKQDKNHDIDIISRSPQTSIGKNDFSYLFGVTKDLQQLFIISLTAKPGYYYFSTPTVLINSLSKNKYSVEESEVRLDNGFLISKTFYINKKQGTEDGGSIDLNFNYSTEKHGLKNIDVGSKIKEIKYLQEELLKTSVDSFEAKFKEIKLREELVKKEAVKQEKKYYLSEQKTTLGAIDTVQINSNNLKKEGEFRNLYISGIPKTVFSVIVKRDSDGAGYNFNSRDFSGGGGGKLTGTIHSVGYLNQELNFPSTDSNETYSVEILTLNGKDNSGKKYPIKINQFSTVELTFALSSAANSGSYDTLPGSYTAQASGPISILWNVSLASGNDNSFTVIKNPDSSDWFVTKNINTDDPSDLLAGTSEIKLDNVIKLGTGLQVTGSSPFSTSGGTQFITGVDSSRSVIKVTSTQDLNDNQALTFSGYGTRGIKTMTNSAINFKRASIVLGETGTTIDSAVSGTTVHVTSTKGIKAAVTGTVNGAVTKATKIILDSVANLGVGMFLTATSSGTLTAIETQIAYIDVASKTIVLSNSQTLPNDATLTFNACKIDAAGISGGAYVSAVSAGANVTSTSSQTLESGIVVSFGAVSSKTATISADLDLTSIGDLSSTITLQLDNILNVH